MNKPSRRSIILLLVYLLVAVGLTVIVLRREARSSEPKNKVKDEVGPTSDKGGPDELSYPTGLFFHRLS